MCIRDSSSTNLQGYAAKEKLASCLFYFPTDSDIKAQLGHFRSALVINNPSPTAIANVRVQLFDRNGSNFTSLSVQVQPNGSWYKGMSELQVPARGVGSARIVPATPSVGASLHYLDEVLIGGTRITDPDPLQPGEGSMQQLQAPQDSARTLYAGPMPLSNTCLLYTSRCV